MPDINLLTGRSFSSDEPGHVQTEEAPIQESGGMQFSEEELSPAVDSEPIRVEVDVNEQADERGESSLTSYKRPSSWPIIAITAGVIILVIVLIINPFKSGDGDSGTGDLTQTENVPGEADNQTQGTQKPSQETEQMQPAETEQTNPEESTPQPDPVSTSQTLSNAVGISLLGDFLAAIPANMKLAFFRYSGEGYLAEIEAATGQTFGLFNNNLASVSGELVPKTISEEQKTVGSRVILVRQIQGSIPQRSTPSNAQNALDTNQIRTNLTEKASRGRLQVRQVEVSPLVSSSGVFIRPATLKLAGDQGAVVRFVQDIFGSYNNVALNKITISRLTNDIDDSRVNAVIDLDVVSN